MKIHCINIVLLLILSAFLITGAISCRKFVAIDPPKTQIVTATVFSSDAAALSALNGIYSQMSSSYGFASGSINSVSLMAGLSADEFVNYSASPDRENFYRNALEPTNAIVSSALWQEPYQYIYDANAILEGAASSNLLTPPTRALLEGESRFIRAFCYFNLVNLFGEIPLVLTTDYRANAVLPRAPAMEVYGQILKDLKQAQSLLAADYSFSGGERVRPNKWAATALLARVYLFTGDWVNAESEATKIIDNSSFQLLTDLNEVFLKNSQEAIWQLMPVVPDYNTNDAISYILTSTPNMVAISAALSNAFEPGDKRATYWVNSFSDGSNIFYYPYKYKVYGTGQPLSEYSMVLRLAEQYLIRAEARMQLNNTAGALSDINIIRARAGLPDEIAGTQETILAAILHERQVELFSEWGHRWMDLKRTKKADAVLSTLKAPNWQSTDSLYPIPQSEISNDVKLTQNAGY